MGTSSSYNGPTGNNSLLPPWADDPDDVPPQDPGTPEPGDDGEQPQTEQPVLSLPIGLPAISWRGPKGILSRLARGDSSVSIPSGLRSYVRASGGAGTAARSARSGRRSTRVLGGFLADGIRRGFAEAVTRLGLGNLLGRDAEFVLAAIIEALAPDGAMREEAIARKATIETLSELFDRYDVEENGLSALDNIDVEAMEEILALSVTNYVNERFQQELVSRIEQGTLSEREANGLSTEIKDFISGITTIDLEGVNLLTLDWNGAEGKRFVERIYQAAYLLLENPS
jgi:hypothetical protein